jgi:hypothetical protein
MSVYNHYRNQAEWWASRCGYTMDDLPEPTSEDIAAYLRAAMGDIHDPLWSYPYPDVRQLTADVYLGRPRRYEPPLEDTP